MNKLTKVIAAGMSSMVAVGVFALPASASHSTTERQVCDAVDPQIVDVTAVVADATTKAAALNTLVGASETAMDTAALNLGVKGLAYIRALDGVGNENTTRTAFVASATAFSKAVTDWSKAVDDQSTNNVTLGLNDAVNRYLKALCPVAPIN